MRFVFQASCIAFVASVVCACGAPGLKEGVVVGAFPVIELPDASVTTPEIIEEPEKPTEPPPPVFVWPDGFVPATTYVSNSHLCEVDMAAIQNGGDPVNLPCRIETDTFSDLAPLTTDMPLKVVSWNIEIGKETARLIQSFTSSPELSSANVLLLQEVPRFDKESRPSLVNFAREAAMALKMNYAFATQWDLRLIEDNQGEHGVAILTRFPIGNLSLIRHASDHNWYKDKQRFGGRVTLGADILVNQQRLRVYVSHFDTRDFRGDVRARQGAEVRSDASLPGRPAVQIAGGDYNTFLCNPALFNCTQPPRAEKVVQDFLNAGWSDLLPGSNTWTQLGGGLAPQRLDWIFGRNVEVIRHRILQDIRVADHVPLVTDISPRKSL